MANTICLQKQHWDRCRAPWRSLMVCHVVLCGEAIHIWDTVSTEILLSRQGVRHLSLERTQAQRVIHLMPSGTEEQWWDSHSSCSRPSTTALLEQRHNHHCHFLEPENMAEKKKIALPIPALFPQSSVGEGN